MRSFYLIGSFLLLGCGRLSCSAEFASRDTIIAGAGGEGSEGGAEIVAVSGRQTFGQGGTSAGTNSKKPSDAGEGGIAHSPSVGSLSDAAGAGSEASQAGGGASDGGASGSDEGTAGAAGAAPVDDGECLFSGLRLQFEDPAGHAIGGIDVAFGDITKLAPLNGYRDIDPSATVTAVCVTDDLVVSGETIYFVWQFSFPVGSCCNDAGCGALQNYIALLNGSPIEVRQEAYDGGYVLAVTAP